MSTQSGFRLRGSYNISVGTASATSATPVPFGITHVRLTTTSSSGAYVHQVQKGATAAAAVGTDALVTQYHPVIVKVSDGDTFSVIGSAAGGVLNVTFLSP